MTEQEAAYRRLIEKRKAFQFQTLVNPSEIEGGRYDCDHLEPWARWMGNLDATVLLVGKDFGGRSFFLRFRGGCDPNSTTNRNLMQLFASIGLDIGPPDNPNSSAPVFFTNSVFGIIDTTSKGGNAISSKTQRENAVEFLKPLIEIIDPKIIITMGKEAYTGTCIALDLERHKSVRNALKCSPISTPEGRVLLAVYHCGGLGLANRSFVQQLSDWKSIKAYL